jgi:branched-chain amino acid transport system permease protein/neutral amino acid transport system permease protein
VDRLVGAFGFGLVTASILAIAAVAFTLQFGITNILNLAFGEIMTLCAYIGYLLNAAGASVWLALVAGAVAGAVFSALLNRTIYALFVRRGTALWGMVIVTIAVALIMQNTLLGLAGPHNFTYTIPPATTFRFAGLILTSLQLEIIGVAIVAMLTLHMMLRYTRLGKAMRATASDPALAQSCGINASRVIDLVWIISGALCGIAGVTLVMNTVSFTASTGSDFLVVIIAAAIVGGVGAPYGAMLGALLVGVTSEVAAVYVNASLKNVFAFALLLVVLLIRPQGFIGRARVAKGVVT